MEFLKSEYKKEWAFMKKEMKILFPVMLIGAVLLTIGTHYGFCAVFKQDSSYIMVVSQTLQEAMSGIDLGADTVGMSIIKLFFNNARASLTAISMGIIPFVFFPLISYFANCMIVGMTTSFASAVGGLRLPFFLAALLPHGIFEIPAIVYSCALGIYMCKETCKIILRKSDKRFGQVAADTLRSYVIVVLPLLAVAAVIEATLTMQIAMKFI